MCLPTRRIISASPLPRPSLQASGNRSLQVSSMPVNCPSSLSPWSSTHTSTRNCGSCSISSGHQQPWQQADGTTAADQHRQHQQAGYSSTALALRPQAAGEDEVLLTVLTLQYCTASGLLGLSKDRLVVCLTCSSTSCAFNVACSHATWHSTNWPEHPAPCKFSVGLTAS